MLRKCRSQFVARRSQEGSAIVIAVIVILVISTLAITVTSRTLSALSSSRRSQDFQAALGGADSGLSDALFRLDQLGDSPTASVCPTTDPMPCTITNVPGSPGTIYTMEVPDPASPNRVRIRSKGISNGVPHAVEAFAKRSLLFPFAIFGDSRVGFSGAGGGACSFGDLGCVSSYPTDTVTAIGTNDALSCVPNNPAEAALVFPPSAAAGCPGATVGTGSYDPQEPSQGPCPAPDNTPTTPCAPADALACPAVAGVLIPAIPAGTYRCNTQVTFPANVGPIGGIVKIFFFPPAGVAPFVINAPTTRVNWPLLTGPGDAGDFQIYAAAAGGEITHGASDQFLFSGVLYAPGMLIRGDGCKSRFNGSIIVDNFDCNGANLSVSYDSRLTSKADSDWSRVDYTEISSSLVVPL